MPPAHVGTGGILLMETGETASIFELDETFDAGRYSI